MNPTTQQVFELHTGLDGNPSGAEPHTEAARAVIVLKRSFNTGFSGIENDLFGKPNTMMVLGDAKKMTESIAKAL